MTTYNNYSKQTSSEKTTLALLEMVGPLFGFVESPVGTWTVNPRYSVVAVKTGTFTYDHPTNTVSIDSSTTPDGIIVTYGLRFSDTAGIETSFDLTDDGPQVYYQPLLEKPNIGYKQSTGPQQNQFTQSGKISIIDPDKDYINLVDSSLYLFENQSAKIYSWNRNLSPTEAQLIFEGNIITSNITDDFLDLELKDLTWQFKDEIPLTPYGDLVNEDQQENLMRRLYGLCNGISIQSIDQIGTGKSIVGTSTISIDSNIMYGVDTKYLEELSSNDIITINNIEYTIERILSDTIVILTDAVEVSLINQPVTRVQNIPDYQYNREFIVAGHQLKRFSTTITSIPQGNRFVVSDTDGFEAGDLVTVGGVSVGILRVCNSTIITNQNVNTATVGTTISRLEVFDVKVENDSISDRDITSISNQDPYTSITLDTDAEINAAKEIVTPYRLHIYGDSRFASINSSTLNRLSFNGFNKIGLYFTVPNEDNDAQINVVFPNSDFVLDGSLTPLELTTVQINARPRVAGSIYNDSTLSVYKIDNGTALVSLGADEPDFILTTSTESGDTFSYKMWNYFNEERSYFIPVLSIGGIEVWGNDTTSYLTFGAGTSGFTISKPYSGDGKFTRVDLNDFLNVKDQVKTNTISITKFNQLLEVNEKNMLFTSLPSVATTNGLMAYKKPNYLSDDKPITCSAYGITKNGTSTGEWISTNPDIIRQELLNRFPNIRLDEPSFTRAKSESPYLPGLKLPLGVADRTPTIEDVINEVNDSCLGNLVLRNDFSIGYEIENGSIDDIDNIFVIRDTQVISDTLSVKTEQSLLFTTKVGNMEVRYDRRDYTFSGELDTLERVENTELKELIGIDVTKEITVNLVRQADVNLLAQDYLFLNSFNNSKVSFTGDLTLSVLNVGDTVLLDLLEIPERRGGYKKFLGKVRSITRNASEVVMTVDNMGSSMERSSIISGGSLDFSSSTVDDRQLSGFITDDNGLIDNDINTYGQNLIG